MKALTALFFSTNYWKDRAEMETAIAAIEEKFDGDKVAVIDGVSEREIHAQDYDFLIVVPCSGAVQPDILKLGEEFQKIVLFAGYVPGNYELELTDKMLCKNAAPTLMDTYSVLKRDPEKIVSVQKNFADLARCRKVLAAYDRVRAGKILVIRGPEPWVISVSRDYEVYEKNLGIRMEVTSQDELIELYEETTFEEAKEIYAFYREDAREIVEPTEEDLMRCARLAKAMLKLIASHQADGIAIACFNLIGRIQVNPCLGVSYINGETSHFAACEGDVDSAVTMLLMQGLTEEKPWMANPCLQQDETINFAHCTAPLHVHGKKQEFLLRNHHETGVGASPRVFYDLGMRMSMFRYSGVEHALTINMGTSVEGRYEPNCRTQMRIRPDDYNHYMDTVLGCHQVMTFEDIECEMRELCRLLQIEVR